MSNTSQLASESVWLDKLKFEDAERVYHEKTGGTHQPGTGSKSNKGGASADLLTGRMQKLELENSTLKKTVGDLQGLIAKLEGRVNLLEGKPAGKSGAQNGSKAEPVKKVAEDDDDDVDLFGSEDDEEAEKLKAQRVADYAAKKSKKPALIAKSSVVLDVKPWDDETDMKVLEAKVREVTMDGLHWGASKLVPLAYGIKKLQIVTVIEDDKVSVEELTENLEAIEDFVQSVDIAAFNKI